MLRQKICMSLIYAVSSLNMLLGGAPLTAHEHFSDENVNARSKKSCNIITDGSRFDYIPK